MSEGTRATVPPQPAPGGHRYGWPAANGHRQPAAWQRASMPPEVAAQVGPAEPIQASSACRAGAHAGCPDRLDVQTGRRCGCRCHRHAERLAYLFYLLAAGAAVIGQVWVAVEHVPWPQGWPVWIRVAAVVPFAVCLDCWAW